mmetsp:Transcript_5586/g.16205  ORF Transcript_5586/g.16205 Transcript_5586/m.16205 type:complete len:540 (-) Transcript_5586:278-1897(-)
MAPFLQVGKVLTLAFTMPQTPKSPEKHTQINHHVSLCSPYSALVGAVGLEERMPDTESTNQDNHYQDAEENPRQNPGPRYESLERLCELLGASPSDLLYLATAEDGERGVYVKQKAKKDDIILRIPISSCLRDDAPPHWFQPNEDDFSSNEDNFEGYANAYDPSEWATRLGATLLEVRLRDDDTGDLSKLHEGLSLWIAMLPDKDFLRASLPVHWDEETINAAKCTALELAVDTAYFTRAETVADISSRLRESAEEKVKDDDSLEEICHDVLDIVQTRTCRVEREDGGGQWGPPLRLLAPIFDFMNHGSSGCNHEGCANAMFQLEGGGITDINDAYIVVKAIKDIDEDDEVLLDYGDSARPAWRCLASYGFVPDYRFLDSNENISDEDGIRDECVAELYLDGVRFEVGPSTIPFEMVEAAAAAQSAEESDGFVTRSNEVVMEHEDDFPAFGAEDQGSHLLTPTVALRIAKRVSDVAFLLLLEPELDIGNDEERNNLSTPEAVIAARLAASLRWSQHQVLLACAVGLRDFAAREQSDNMI